VAAAGLEAVILTVPVDDRPENVHDVGVLTCPVAAWRIVDGHAEPVLPQSPYADGPAPWDIIVMEWRLMPVSGDRLYRLPGSIRPGKVFADLDVAKQDILADAQLHWDDFVEPAV
jgi:hypothetical protein